MSRNNLPTRPVKATTQNVLALMAHPGDAAVLCGGTLARFAATGAKVTIACVSDGAAGNKLMPVPREKLAPQRRRHEEQACSVIGADLGWVGLADGLLFDQTQMIGLLVDLVRQIRPDIVITHHSRDYHMDNRTVSNAAYQACRLCLLENFPSKLPPMTSVPMLYYTDSWISRAFEPTEYVDISDSIDTKLKMVRSNKVGVNWLRKLDGLDIFGLVKTTAAFRGMQSACRYAEVFAADPSWPVVHTRRLLP